MRRVVTIVVALLFAASLTVMAGAIVTSISWNVSPYPTFYRHAEHP
jgi:hypothetical protein